MRMKETDNDDSEEIPETAHLQVKRLAKEKNSSTMGIDYQETVNIPNYNKKLW